MPIEDAPPVFKCFTHDLSCDNLPDWKAHLEAEEHVYSSQSLCSRCGVNRVKTKSKLKLKASMIAPSVYCPDCLEDIKDEQGEAEIIVPTKAGADNE